MDSVDLNDADLDLAALTRRVERGETIVVTRDGQPVADLPQQLVVTAGSLVGTRINLGTAPILIGRADDSTLVLTDDFASSRHARLTRRSDGEWLVEDLGSTNGTYLDRQRVSAPLHVPLGVPIRIGKTVLELRA